MECWKALKALKQVGMMVVLERELFVLVGELSKPGRRSTFFGSRKLQRRLVSGLWRLAASGANFGLGLAGRNFGRPPKKNAPHVKLQSGFRHRHHDVIVPRSNANAPACCRSTSADAMPLRVTRHK